MRSFRIFAFRISVACIIFAALGLTSAQGQRVEVASSAKISRPAARLTVDNVMPAVGFVAKDAPVFCKYVRRPESCPPPLMGYSVPVYSKAPDRDFFILGEVMVSPRLDYYPETDALKWRVTERMARTAKERGGDAIWMVTPFAPRYCQALVIKWWRR